MKIQDYEVVFEWVDTEEGGNWGAYFPDGPCVISTGKTREEVARLQAQGLEALREYEREKAAARENGAHAPR